MKTLTLISILALGCLPVWPLQANTPPTEVVEEELLTPDQIDELLAPIALYPDPLIAIMLPAATFPTDIVLAARFLEADRNPEDIENQPWDDSVKSLARYPEVLNWMNENLEWTQQVGNAFILQPAAVLTSTQRLRAAALAAGNLKDTPEQKVVVEREVIRIVPARREVIYVPVYDPYWVYHPYPYPYPHSSVVVVHPRPVITFSIGYPTGFWLAYHCDWHVRSVIVVGRPYRTVVWSRYPYWHVPPRRVVHQHHHHYHVWNPPPARVTSVRREVHVHRTVHHSTRPAQPAQPRWSRNVAPEWQPRPRGDTRIVRSEVAERWTDRVAAPASTTEASQRRTSRVAVADRTTEARPSRQDSRTERATTRPAARGDTAVSQPVERPRRPAVQAPRTAPPVMADRRIASATEAATTRPSRTTTRTDAQAQQRPTATTRPTATAERTRPAPAPSAERVVRSSRTAAATAGPAPSTQQARTAIPRAPATAPAQPRVAVPPTPTPESVQAPQRTSRVAPPVTNSDRGARWNPSYSRTPNPRTDPARNRSR